jgi:hypothetical protein
MVLGIVCMNDETMQTGFRKQFKNWVQNLFDVIRRVKCSRLWKDFDNVKPEMIPCDCDYHFSRLVQMLFPFRWWFAISNQMVS